MEESWRCAPQGDKGAPGSQQSGGISPGNIAPAAPQTIPVAKLQRSFMRDRFADKSPDLRISTIKRPQMRLARSLRWDLQRRAGQSDKGRSTLGGAVTRWLRGSHEFMFRDSGTRKYPICGLGVCDRLPRTSDMLSLFSKAFRALRGCATETLAVARGHGLRSLVLAWMP